MFDKLKDWWGKHGNWNPKTTLLILAFLALIFFMFANEADAAERETRAELAPALFVAGDPYKGGLLSLEERWNNKYAIGLGLTSTWQCWDADNCKRGDGEQNQFVYAERVVRPYFSDHFEMGIGVSYWHKQTPAWNSHTPFLLHIGWNFNDQWAVKWRHFSTGGSSSKNGGLDYLSISYSF